MSKRLIDAKAKIERVVFQIDDLRTKIESFVSESPYEIRSRVNQEKEIEIWKYHITKEPPVILPIITGEILHNLRSSLDQIVCTIADEKGSGADRQTFFPFGKNAEGFENQLSKQGKNLPHEAQDLIRSFRPYFGGNNLLYAIHDLNRRDKHIETIPVQVRVSVENTTFIVHTGRIDTLGPRSGRHLIRDANNNMSQPVAASQPQLVLESGRPRIAFETALGKSDEFELATGVPGSTFTADFQPVFDIAIYSPIDEKPVPLTSTLKQMHEVVRKIFETFEGRFFN